MSSEDFLKFEIPLAEDNFIKGVMIPPAIRPHHEEKITKEWLLKTSSSSNKMWAVEVRQRGQEYLLCGKSWKMFAESQNLTKGDNLNFRHLTVTVDLCRFSVFDVEIFDRKTHVPKRGCPPPYPSVISFDITRNDAYPGGKDPIDDDENDDDSVEVPAEQYTTRIKKKFAEATARRSLVDPQKLKRSEGSDQGKGRIADDDARLKQRIVTEDEITSHVDPQKLKKLKTSEIRLPKTEPVTSEEETEEETSEEEEENVIYFELTFTSSHVRYMYFPLGFGRKAGLKRKKSITLVNVDTDEKWEIALTKAADGRISMGTGWSRFRNDNKIKIGDEYMFGFVQDEDEDDQLLFKKKA